MLEVLMFKVAEREGLCNSDWDGDVNIKWSFLRGFGGEGEQPMRFGHRDWDRDLNITWKFLRRFGHRDWADMTQSQH